MLTLQKLIRVCKFLANLVVPEDEVVFECRPEFFWRKTPADPAYSTLSYKNPEVKKLIHAFKYHKNSTALKICANFVVKNIINFTSSENIVGAIIVPIPRSKLRTQKYGFNQCDLLCLEILKKPEIKKLNLIYEPKILIHIKSIETQTKLSRSDRIKNSNKSFLVNLPEKICGRKVILVDDVWTTGATILSAEKSLIEHGANSVFKFTIAH